jgi:uncharacterized membrane protein YfhO
MYEWNGLILEFVIKSYPAHVGTVLSDVADPSVRVGLFVLLFYSQVFDLQVRDIEHGNLKLHRYRTYLLTSSMCIRLGLECYCDL